eukprot:s3600_g13.t1
MGFKIVLKEIEFQPLVRQQFPLKLACALDARYRRPRSQNAVAGPKGTPYDNGWSAAGLDFPGRVPWRHQIEAVDCILHALSDDGRRNLLVQHATGSGKSATMALLVHQLAEQAQSDPRKKGFALILLLSDRLQLDRQFLGGLP